MASRASSRIFIGVGGWNFAPWRGTFYPEGLVQREELAHASRALTSIEINSTFYGPQKPATFQRWHDETPDHFVFAVKAPRFTTHRRVLGEAGDSIDRFLDGGVLRLGAKLGPINWQFAPTKPFEAEDFARFMALLPKERGGLRLRHALEVRHASFVDEAFVALARKNDVAIVIAGDSHHPQIADITASFSYLRIMGTQKSLSAGYAAADLTRWANRAKALAAGEVSSDLSVVSDAAVKARPRDVYLYVISGAKERNPLAARALIERLAKPAKKPVSRRR